MEIKKVPISKIETWKNNPRKISNEGLKRIEKSIKKFGFVSPIIARENKGKIEIVVGHQRLKAAKRAKLKEIPVVIFPFKNKKEAQAYNIADNRLNELSQWDFPLLKDAIEELDTGALDIEITGFSNIEIEALMGNYGEPPYSNIIKDQLKEVSIKLYLSEIGYELFNEAIDVALFGEDIKTYDRAMRKSFEIIDSRKRGEALAKICKDWLIKCAGVV